VVVGDGPELALLVADDRRDRIGLDDQVVLEALSLVHRRQCRGLVGVPDRDQSRHPYLLTSRRFFGSHSGIEAGSVVSGLTRSG
jgi:hypothetical protein